MKVEYKTIDKERGIVQITTSDSRWYLVDNIYYPSVTWVCSYYPKGIGYMRWFAEHGYDEAEAIKVAAGEKGSRVHHAISDILLGNAVKIDDKYSADGEEPKELTSIEYEAIMSFVGWLNQTQPEVLKIDYTLVNEKDNYAGTIDMKVKINGEVWIIDVKTSKDIYPSHELQVSAYKHSDSECQKIAILQVGYSRNKAKFKFTEIEDQYPLFKAAQQIWTKETAGIEPLQKDFPLELSWNKSMAIPAGDRALKKTTKLKVKRKIVKKKK